MARARFSRFAAAGICCGWLKKRKEESSFLKKRSKKLFPRAERGFATTCFARSLAIEPEILRRWSLSVRSTREKFFASFFQKRRFFLPLKPSFLSLDAFVNVRLAAFPIPGGFEPFAGVAAVGEEIGAD
jgi:hypothetical protein